MKELKKAVSSLADDAAGAEPAAADAGGGGGGAGALQGKAAARAKKADDYHARHPDWVTQFNALTNGECAGGPGGVKWSAVRSWQQKHWEANNLFADGMVGPKTIEAAKIVGKQAKAGGKDEGEKKDKADAGAAGDDKQHEGKDDKQHEGAKGGGDEMKDAAAGNPEAAEASLDKPKLDEPDGSAEHASNDAAPVESDAGKRPAESEQSSDDLRLPPGGDAASKPHSHSTRGQFEEALVAIDKLLERFKPEAPAGASAGQPKATGAEGDEKGAKQADQPTGAMMTHLGEYLADAKRLATEWPKSSTKGRCHALLEAINKALRHEHVFPIQDAIAIEQSGIAGQFHPDKWTMTLDQGLFSNSALREKEIHEAASTVFHEGRHAEQRFLMARMLATEGKDELTIASELKMEKEAASRAWHEAKKHPLNPESREGQQAKKMHADAIGNEKEHRSIEMLASQVTTAGNHAATLFEALPEGDKQKLTEKWNSYRARMHQAIDAYKSLPTEQDAYAAEAELNRK